MNVVHLDSHMSWRGGEQQVLYLTQRLHAGGHHSVVICPPHSALYQRAREAGLPTEALRMRHELDLVAAWHLGQYLRRQHVEILHMHTRMPIRSGCSPVSWRLTCAWWCRDALILRRPATG